MQSNSSLRLPRILDDLDICIGKPSIRVQFYKFLEELNLADGGKNPTEDALKLGVAELAAQIKSYYSWSVYFIYDQLKFHGFEPDGRFLTSMSDYNESYFTKKYLTNRKYMSKPLTPTELRTILNDYTDDEGNPTAQSLEDNIAKINSGFSIIYWNIGGVQKLFDFFTNNKKNANQQDLICYLNNNH